MIDWQALSGWVYDGPPGQRGAERATGMRGTAARSSYEAVVQQRSAEARSRTAERLGEEREKFLEQQCKEALQ